MTVVDLQPARQWLDLHGERAAVVPHGDADGLSAGALLTRRARGAVLHLESPWDESLPPAAAEAAVIADWGVRPVAGTEAALYVDHHAEPEPVAGAVLHTAAGGATTSTLAWELLDRPEDGEWLAALGVVGDLGAGALKAHAELTRGRSTSALRRLASLVTAPGRVLEGPVADAFAVLVESTDEHSAFDHPRIKALERALERVGDSRARAVRTAPAVGPEAALTRFSEPARVHPLVAVAWARRLAPRVVVAANDGWRDGRVAFAVRSADGRDLRAWLRERYAPPAGAGDYGRGHARATGGALVPEAFERFAAAIL
jgi:single-stranded-DNA-specific exonuclease